MSKVLRVDAPWVDPPATAEVADAKRDPYVEYEAWLAREMGQAPAPARADADRSALAAVQIATPSNPNAATRADESPLATALANKARRDEEAAKGGVPKGALTKR